MMSDLRDSLSERTVEGNSRPTTSQTAAPPPLRSKSSLNNNIKEIKISSTSKKSPKRSMPRQKPPEEARIPSRTFTNSDIASQCQNLSLNSESAAVNQGDSPALKKNAKKRERLKQNLNLEMPTPGLAQLQNPQVLSHEHVSYPIHNHTVQELFMTQIGPLYASTSSRYLENLSHHPQFQYMHNTHTGQSRQQLITPPNTPLMQLFQRPNSANTPHTSLPYSDPSTPRFFQNIMQHPLLSRQQNLMSFAGSYSAPVTKDQVEKKTPRKRILKKNEQCTEYKKFDCYMSVAEVEEGLKNNTLIAGVLRINPKQFQHAYVSSTDRSEQDVLLDGIRHRNRALEGDIVVVQMINDEQNDSLDDEKQKKGKVVYIKERVHPRTCIGTLKIMPDKNRQKALFIPRDHRVPRLNILVTCWPDNFYEDAKRYENTLFLAKIVEWSDTRYALGKIVCHIGQSGDIVSETKAILAQTDLDIHPFGPELRHLFPQLDSVIPDKEFEIREDCRKLCIFSIDPSNCRDIDDAVSCRELANGNYEIGVHISDVAHYLTENTPLDEKVADKATTIYMVERAYHMLPEELCMLCSLFPGTDKLAFSVFWEITPEAKVLNHRFSKTVINSCCQLSYDHAQAILEDKEDSAVNFPETYNGFHYKDVHKSIKVLGKISSQFRTRRFDNGALRIDQPKVTFHLNPADGLPESFYIYESKESHQLIEEFMLLANMTVAERILHDHPKLAFLRSHPPPSKYMLNQLCKALQPLGINLDVSSAGDLHRSLLPYVGSECNDKGKAMVLNMLCAKPMARAKYFCAGGCEDDEDFEHYALNVPLYTHFTSPIRRYADIMVHRLLAASLKYREIPTWEVDKVRMVAAQCNKQKYNAKKAGELSTELYTLKYIESHSPMATEAVVVEVRDKYIDVIIAAMGLNRRIFFNNNDFPGEYRCIKNEAGTKMSKMELTWPATATQPQIVQIVEVFSILQVEMFRGDDMVKVETKLVRPQ